MNNKKQELFMENVRLSGILEKSLAFYVMVNPKEVFRMYSFVEPKHFYSKDYARVYELVKKSQVDGSDLISLLQKELGEKAIVSSMYEEAYHSSVNLRNYDDVAKQIRKLNQVRELHFLFSDSVLDIDHMNFDERASEMHTKFMEICTLHENERSDAKQVLEDYQKVQEENAEKIIQGKSIIGVSCGFDKLDQAIDGFRPEHMWTIMAYTSLGKSTFTLNMVASLISRGQRVVFYSLEMSKVDIVSRILGILTEMNGRKILKGQLEVKEYELVKRAKSLIEDSKISIHTDLSDLESIRLSMMEEMLRGKVDLFVVDYIQQVQVVGAQSIYDQMSAAASVFQNTAKQLRVPLVIVSQISNEAARGSKNADVIGAKGAGEIAAKSDLVAWLVSNEEDQVEYSRKLSAGEPTGMKLRIMKNRHGDTGNILFDFDRKTGVFYQDFKDK